jgi:hypothetical protein
VNGFSESRILVHTPNVSTSPCVQVDVQKIESGFSLQMIPAKIRYALQYGLLSIVPIDRGEVI